MAKRIKFPLKMGNGESVRNIEELRDNFDLASVITYFSDGKLITWLENRYYEKEIEAIKTLKQDDPNLGKKLCELFGVAYEEIPDRVADFSLVAQRNQKLSVLKQYTMDTELYERVDSIAFTQKELQELLDKKLPEIYLLNNTFVVPSTISNVTLNGIGKVTVQVFSDQFINFEKHNVTFNNISFDDAYQRILYTQGKIEFEQIADQKYANKDYEGAIDYYKRAAALKSTHAFYQLGNIFEQGLGVEKDSKAAFEYYQEGSLLVDGKCSCKLGDFYHIGKYVKEDGVRAQELYFKALQENYYDAYTQLGILYFNGAQGIEADSNQAIKYWENALEKGCSNANYYLGLAYVKGEDAKYNFDKAKAYLLESAKDGNAESYYVLGRVYKDGDIRWDLDLAIEYFKEGAKLGSANCYYQIGEVLFNEKLDRTSDEIEKQKLIDEAKQWYLKAGENGNGDGYGTYGLICLLEGEDYTHAADILEKGVSLGSDIARFALGQIYVDPDKAPSGKCDYHKAYELYKVGAEHEDPDCMYGLAEMYLYGSDAVERDLEKAKSWIEKANSLSPGNDMYNELYDKIHDTINPNREKIEISQNDLSCFITTAVCGSLNKPDDCDELTAMRWLRDKLKVEDPDMAVLIEEYYRVAPLVVKKIDSKVDAPVVYRQLWDNSISKIYGDIKQKDYRDAKLRYISMLEDLCGRYDVPLANGIYKKINKIREQ